MLLLICTANFVSLWRCCPTPAMASTFSRFLGHAQRRTTVGRTPLDERSAVRRDLYQTTHKHPCRRRDSNPHSQQAHASDRHTATYDIPAGCTFRVIFIKLHICSPRQVADSQKALVPPKAFPVITYCWVAWPSGNKLMFTERMQSE